MPVPSRGPSRSARPALHLTAPKGWLNDPHGMHFHDGRYHLFYQANPASCDWVPGISWGHASSADLVTWRDHPIAVSPGDGEIGCWTGDLVPDPDGGATIFYTSVREPNLDLAQVRSARALDATWDTWAKGPVVFSPPEGEPLRIFRDPTVYAEGEGWRMLVGAGYHDGTAAVLSYASLDLAHWTYQGRLAEGAAPDIQSFGTGWAWECPQLLTFGDRQVLVVSLWAESGGQYVAAGVGSSRQGDLEIEHWSQLTFGEGHYAPTAFVDREGEQCLIFWIRGVGDQAEGWAGAMSIPYRVSLVDDRLSLSPHPNVMGARELNPELDARHVQGFELTGARVRVTTAAGLVVAEVERGPDGIEVRTSAGAVRAPEGEGVVQIMIDGAVLEVCTGRALIGLLASWRGDLEPVTGEGVTPWWGWAHSA